MVLMYFDEGMESGWFGIILFLMVDMINGGYECSVELCIVRCSCEVWGLGFDFV